MINVNVVAHRMRGAPYTALKSQMVRAAMSIAANIVEGRAQLSEKEFARFLGYAIASSRELEYHLIAAHAIGALSDDEHDRLVAQTIDVRRMLYGLANKLKAE
jgi:four helix bundle protein